MEKTINPINLLIIGPLPPPIGGSPLTLQVILEELKKYSNIIPTVINTSPSTKVNKKMTGFNLEKVKRLFSILYKFMLLVRKNDVILVFANDLFAFILVPLLVLGARINKKKIYLKPVGSNLDQFMEKNGEIVKRLMLFVFKSTNGLFTQTKLLTEWFQKHGCKNAYYLPGLRPYQSFHRKEKDPSDQFRIVFLAHITLLKGPLVLLDALRILEERNCLNIECDFYGPIHDDVEKQFRQKLNNSKSANYKGLVDPGMGSEIISQYDLLVLPTSFDSEGHPGVIIEAMQVGIPVITTQKRTLYELVTPGENGLMVPAGDADSLANAIEFMALNADARIRMGKANFSKGYEFRSDIVVGKLVEYLVNEKPI